MCVILEKIAGKEIPYQHLLAAAHRNPDGYGVAVHDRGSLEIIQGLSKKPDEAADAVQRVLEQAKDKAAFIHFRYRTVGDVSVANLHPIPILKKTEDGIDLTFMHNGTVSQFRGDANESDSVVFANQIVAPLARRSAAYLGQDEITSDPVLADILKRYSENASKFVLFDSNGNSMVINRPAGAEQEYGWASNSYSLAESNIPRERDKAKSSATTTSTVHYSNWPKRPADNDHAKLVDTLNRNAGVSSTEQCAPSVRLTVEEITGHKPRAFCRLDSEQVRELIEEEPDLSAILILDLLYELYNQEFGSSKAAA